MRSLELRERNSEEKPKSEGGKHPVKLLEEMSEQFVAGIKADLNTGSSEKAGLNLNLDQKMRIPTRSTSKNIEPIKTTGEISNQPINVPVQNKRSMSEERIANSKEQIEDNVRQQMLFSNLFENKDDTRVQEEVSSQLNKNGITQSGIEKQEGIKHISTISAQEDLVTTEARKKNSDSEEKTIVQPPGEPKEKKGLVKEITTRKSRGKVDVKAKAETLKSAPESEVVKTTTKINQKSKKINQQDNFNGRSQQNFIEKLPLSHKKDSKRKEPHNNSHNTIKQEYEVSKPPTSPKQFRDKETPMVLRQNTEIQIQNKKKQQSLKRINTKSLSNEDVFPQMTQSLKNHYIPYHGISNLTVDHESKSDEDQMRMKVEGKDMERTSFVSNIKETSSLITHENKLLSEEDTATLSRKFLKKIAKEIVKAYELDLQSAETIAKRLEVTVVKALRSDATLSHNEDQFKINYTSKLAELIKSLKVGHTDKRKSS